MDQFNENIKKKRGRKPKNNTIEENITEKKKRGRKKKYEIENFDKICNRDRLNNFDHNIVYSDDEEAKCMDEGKSNVSFGNLNITVSKKVTNQQETFKNLFSSTINENEYSDEEIQKPDVKVYNETKKYSQHIIEESKKNNDYIKNMKVISTMKNIINEESWPESVDICCWWCCHTFQNSPCTLPIKYDPLRKRYNFIGVFCSWNCVKAYNFDQNDYRRYERSSLITLLIKQMYGIVEAINIKVAPPRQTLKMFGGYKEISEFRNSANVTDSYHMNLSKYNFVYPEITETTNVKLKQEKKNLRLTRS
jgi:hypothetical protein